MSLIRQFRNADLPALVDVWIQHWSAVGPSPAVSVAMIEQAILAKTFFSESTLLVATVDEKVVAWCHFYPATIGQDSQPRKNDSAGSGGSETQESQNDHAASEDYAELATERVILNSICFTPDGTQAYFSSTRDGKVWRTDLDGDGWPMGEPTLLFHEQGYLIDGMVCASDGTLWNTQYKAGRVAVYSPQGQLLETHPIPGRHTTCPGFGGADLTTLFVTTARQDVPPEECAANPAHGQTFALDTNTVGQAEHKVIL